MPQVIPRSSEIIIYPGQRPFDGLSWGSEGGYTDAVVAAIEAQAAQKVADASSTAAIEGRRGPVVAGVRRRRGGRRRLGAAGDHAVLVDAGRPVAGPRVRQLVGDHHDRRRGTRSGARRVLELRSSEHSRRRTGGRLARKSHHLRPVVVVHAPRRRDRLVYLRWGTSPGTRYRARGRHRGRTPPPASKAKPNAASPTRPPDRSPNSSLSPKTVATPTTTATRSPDCAPTSPEREAKHSSWKPPPPGGAKAAQAPRNATGRPHASAR